MFEMMTRDGMTSRQRGREYKPEKALLHYRGAAEVQPKRDMAETGRERSSLEARAQKSSQFALDFRSGVSEGPASSNLSCSANL